MQINPYLKLMADKQASDLFFSTGAPVNIKIEGITSPVNDKPLPPGMVNQLAYRVISEEQKKTFEETMELNFSISIEYIGRFRVNLYRQRGETAMVIRFIKSRIPSIEELKLPPILKQLVLEPRGLVLLVGSTGSGKSTTLASMIDYRNTTMTGHILTIEEPIEYIHQHKKSIVDQREVGIDTLSYANALKNAMREAPDVILIGEIRDRETMQQAIAYADTGHLCLSTLHANNANQTLDRIVNFFPDSAHHQVLQDLSLNLRAVVSQRLIRGIDGKRVPAVEILLKSPYIADLIEKGDVSALKDAIEKSSDSGMQTFDQSLFELYSSGKIDMEEALANADSRNNLAVKIRLAKGVSVGGSDDGLSIGDDFS
ncbi:MAG: PilT/PilU family type 4a pilus ATPase [Proteobacteria bacterium]|nr:PilT/PilU family type 4a pilus ATPase [Pseudomonadota bacterium]